MSGREDHDLGFAKVTRKVMPNGEIRTRMKLLNDITTTVTEMPNWKWKDGVPVQEGHFHKGLIEQYFVLTGWMLCVGLVVPVGCDVRVVEQGENIVFLPNMRHLVLLGPHTIIQTTTTGSSIGNPDKNGVDWWPVGNYYQKVIFNEKMLMHAREEKRRAEWRSRHVILAD